MNCNMTLIIGISGKKQAGKSSLAKFIQASLFKNAYNTYNFEQRPDGTIQWVLREGHHDVCEVREPPHVEERYAVYSFADPLKQDVCMKVLGLTHEQCYGTDEEKNSLTKYNWEDMSIVWNDGSPDFRRGAMTAREILQCVGTDIFRANFGEEIWVKATLNIIALESPEVALVPDVRFRSEVEGIWSQGGHVIRLKRQLFNDSHASEVDLDDYDFEAIKRCFEIDNNDLSLSAKNDIATGILNTILEEKTNV